MPHVRLTHLAILAATASAVQGASIQSVQPFVGVTHYRLIQSANDPSPLAPGTQAIVMDVMKIDTQAAGISFLMQDGNGSAPGEITRQTTRSFVDQKNAQIGINVGFYDTAATYGGLYTDLVYASASNGNVYSTARGGEAMFNIGPNNELKIGNAKTAAGSTTFRDDTPFYNASGGNQRILTNGVEIDGTSSYTTTLNPHTALGIDRNARYLYLATVDGRQGAFSGGMRTDDMAIVLRDQFGVWNAVNLDGGGSTTMVMDDTNDGLANARIVNSPSDNSSVSKAGTERVVANSLAVFATPMTGYTRLATVPRPGLTGVVDVHTAPVRLDDFENGSKGRFASAVAGSGSSQHISTTSTSVVDTSEKHTGNSSLKLNIVNTGETPARTQLRFLSGGGSPANNLTNGDAMGNGGYVGTMIKMPVGSAPLYVSILIDDQTTASASTERGEFFRIIADGQWHLYQWNLDEDGNWANFSGGNGVIDGPNAFIDSLYFSSAPGTTGGDNFSGSLWIDSVSYNPNGRLDAILLPEPASLMLGVATLGLMGRRRG